MAFAFLDALAGNQVINIHPGIIRAGRDVSSVGRHLATAQSDQDIWWAFYTTCGIGVIHIPEQELSVLGTADHLVVMVLPLRDAGDVASHRGMLDQSFVLLQIIGDHQLILTRGVNHMRTHLIQDQICHGFPMVLEGRKHLPRLPVPEAYSAVSAAGDHEVRRCPNAGHALPVAVHLPQLFADTLLGGPGANVAVIVGCKDLTIGKDGRAHGRLGGGAGDGHVIRQVQEKDLPSVRDGAHHITALSKGQVRHLARVGGALQGAGEIRREQAPHLSIPGACDQLGAIRGRGQGHDTGFQHVFCQNVPLDVEASKGLDSPVSACHE
mmetsp:Transcript_3936/g.6475  ORF Transcript_3936/g.6475 Transcript_3936/m.6475 type:complete len:324 (-) Transcript_3936:844-1815(-)